MNFEMNNEVKIRYCEKFLKKLKIDKFIYKISQVGKFED